jgi:hypothetical protein
VVVVIHFIGVVGMVERKFCWHFFISSHFTALCSSLTYSNNMSRAVGMVKDRTREEKEGKKTFNVGPLTVFFVKYKLIS